MTYLNDFHTINLKNTQFLILAAKVREDGQKSENLVS